MADHDRCRTMPGYMEKATRQVAANRAFRLVTPISSAYPITPPTVEAARVYPRALVRSATRAQKRMPTAPQRYTMTVKSCVWTVSNSSP